MVCCGVLDLVAGYGILQGIELFNRIYSLLNIHFRVKLLYQPSNHDEENAFRLFTLLFMYLPSISSFPPFLFIPRC